MRPEAAEEFFAATTADVRHADKRTIYSPKHDHIRMPPFEKLVRSEKELAVISQWKSFELERFLNVAQRSVT